MKKYPKYKDSGIPWIGEIPKEWEVKTLSQLSKEQSLSNKGMINNNLLSLSYGRIIQKNINTTDGLLPASFETYQIVNNGNIILRLTDLQNDHKSLRVGLVTQTGIITSAYVALAPNKYVSSAYLYYSLHSIDVKKVFYSMGGGLRQNLNWSELRKLFVQLPTPAEQRAIASFLEKKNEQINNCICLRERELQTLNELKQAQIANVVTKGLDPNVPMKDSGIPWIGQIPEHWEVNRNKVFLSEKKEVVGDRTDFPLLSLTKEGVILRDIESGKGKFPKDFNTYKIVNKEDIIFCLFDIDETPRTVGLSNLNGMITGAYNVFSIKNINKKYLYYTYLAIDNKKGLRPLYTGLRKVVNTDRFLSSKMPLPPIEEQDAIVQYIENSELTIDTYIASLQAEIEHLKEYKQRLISDVVTGKIDVRDEA